MVTYRRWPFNPFDPEPLITPTKCLAKGKKIEVRKAKEDREKMLKEILKFCYLCTPELYKLIPAGSEGQNVYEFIVNCFMAILSSL